MNACTRIITDKNCNVVVLDNTLEEGFIQIFLLKLSSSAGTVSTEIFIKSETTQTVAFGSSQDGFYTLCKVTIPLDNTSSTYYDNGRYYHNGEKVSLQDIIDMPTETSGVDIEYSYFFSTCNLKKCFVKICQEIFNSKHSMCSQKEAAHSLIYKRDLLLSALHVIQYLAEMDQMLEAQRLLEEITSCNGLCQSSQQNSGCGCGR